MFVGKNKYTHTNTYTCIYIGTHTHIHIYALKSDENTLKFKWCLFLSYDIKDDFYFLLDDLLYSKIP